MDNQQISNLLREFNKMSYADENAKYIDQEDHSKLINHEIILENDKYRYSDRFWGGEPYGGYEMIYKNDKEIFGCFYYGKVFEGNDFGSIYTFLREALRSGIENSSTIVHRGPKEFSNNDFKYMNNCEGDISYFNLTEEIYLKEKLIYIAKFNGGYINLN